MNDKETMEGTNVRTAGNKSIKGEKERGRRKIRYILHDDDSLSLTFVP
jgi:hypothetical protein